MIWNEQKKNRNVGIRLSITFPPDAAARTKYFSYVYSSLFGFLLSINRMICFHIARPKTNRREFLEQLLDCLKSGERDEDGRTHDQLAADLGLSATVLASFSHADPQRAILHVFNATYPTNEEKESLINVGNLAAMRPQFLSDLLSE